MKKITIAALLLTACITHAAPTQKLMPIRWTADGSQPVAAALSLAQGETRDLICTLKNYGQHVTVPDTATAALYYQTNGMGSLYWTAPATVTTNGIVTATWSPALDAGAPVYNFALGVDDGSTNRIYTAYGIIRLRLSPGHIPNTLPLPRASLDFDAVDILNAPWATQTDLDAAISNIPPVVETDPVALPIATQALGLAQSITLDSLGGVTNTAPTIYGPLRIEGPVPRLYIQGPSPRITISDTATSKAVELQMSRFFWGPNAMYSADFPSANGTFALEGYADQAASSAVTAHNSSASAHASLFSGLASETWVTATRAKWSDIATNVVYQVVVSNGHWLIKEVQ